MDPLYPCVCWHCYRTVTAYEVDLVLQKLYWYSQHTVFMHVLSDFIHQHKLIHCLAGLKVRLTLIFVVEWEDIVVNCCLSAPLKPELDPSAKQMRLQMKHAYKISCLFTSWSSKKITFSPVWCDGFFFCQWGTGYTGLRVLWFRFFNPLLPSSLMCYFRCADLFRPLWGCIWELLMTKFLYHFTRLCRNSL